MREARSAPRTGARERDEAACQAALAKLTAAGESGEGNLLELAVDAARARASVGEISDALEEAWGRHRAVIRSISGVYGSAYEGDRDFMDIRKTSKSLRRAKAAGRACWSSNWARTVTTAAPR